MSFSVFFCVTKNGDVHFARRRFMFIILRLLRVREYDGRCNLQ